MRWAALAALLFTALLRAQSTRVRLPYWDLDPTRVQVPETALLYSHGFLLDALVWLAAALTIVGESLAGRRIHWRSGLLVVAGAVGVVLHGYILPPPGATPGGPLKGDFMGLALGSAWAAAMVGGWTILHLARDPQMRRAAALALFSFAAILVAKGAYQVYVEHAYTISAYKKDPVGMLAAQGLNQGSTAAKEYERRLFQPEPLGWFGLSNVYATFVAASFIFFLGLSIGAWKLVKEKAITSGPAGALSLAAIASLFGLSLSGSKGGWGAMLAGGIVLLVGSLSLWERMSRHVRGCETGEGSVPTPSTSRSSSSGFFSRVSPIAHCLLPIALCLTTLLAVAARGLIGERLTELSLLFRWHYLVAATRIFASESLFGVGPMGFKNAYALHKVPINPEMVESPHSVFFDWAATLGAFGLCWCFVLIWLLLRVGTSFITKPEPRNPKPEPWRSYAPVLAATVLASIAAWTREFQIVTADEWPVRLIALAVCIAFIVIGTKIAALAPRTFTISLAAAASVVAVHSMIEMTPTQPGSCMLVSLAIAVASCRGISSRVVKMPGAIMTVVLAQIPLVVGIITLIYMYPLASQRCERLLRRSAHQARTIAEIDRLRHELDDANQRRVLELIVEKSDLKRQGTWEQERPGSLEAQALDLRAALIMGVESDFMYLSQSVSFGEFTKPGPAPLVQAVLLSLKFQLLHIDAFNVSRDAKMKYADISELVERYGDSPTLMGSVAGYFESAAEKLQSEPLRKDALSAWLRVTQLDPYSLTPALNAYRLARQLGETETARNMAARALRNNDYLRLDPLKQLDPAQVADLERFLAETIPNPSQTTPSEPVNPPPPT